LMADLAVVGHIAIDRIIDTEGERTQLGGPPTYVSLAARRLGKRVDVVTKVGEDIPDDFISQLRMLRVDLGGMIVEGAETTRFVLDYRGADRLLSVGSVCEEISPEEVSELQEAVLIAPIVGEIPPSTVSQIDVDLIALDPQGFVREIRDDGRVLLRHWFDGELLKRLTVFKSSEWEMRLITGEANALWGLKKVVRLGAKVALATRGRQGVLLATRRQSFRIPAFRVMNVLDPTGAGDAFVGGFLLEYLDGEEPLWCASVGAAAASCTVETFGAKLDASVQEVRRRAEEIFNSAERI
jgi:sugar/nucleoside kinase (ribokinase family)